MIPSGAVSTILSHKGNAICTISPEATVFKAIQMMAEKKRRHGNNPYHTGHIVPSLAAILSRFPSQSVPDPGHPTQATRSTPSF